MKNEGPEENMTCTAYHAIAYRRGVRRHFWGVSHFFFAAFWSLTKLEPPSSRAQNQSGFGGEHKSVNLAFSLVEAYVAGGFPRIRSNIKTPHQIQNGWQGGFGQTPYAPTWVKPAGGEVRRHP